MTKYGNSDLPFGDSLKSIIHTLLRRLAALGSVAVVVVLVALLLVWVSNERGWGIAPPLAAGIISLASAATIVRNTLTRMVANRIVPRRDIAKTRMATENAVENTRADVVEPPRHVRPGVSVLKPRPAVRVVDAGEAVTVITMRSLARELRMLVEEAHHRASVEEVMADNLLASLAAVIRAQTVAERLALHSSSLRDKSALHDVNLEGVRVLTAARAMFERLVSNVERQQALLQVHEALLAAPTETDARSHANRVLIYIAAEKEEYDDIVNAVREAYRIALALNPVDRLWSMPVDAAGVDLSAVSVRDLDSLYAVVWSEDTIWPSAVESAIYGMSETIGPGLYRVVGPADSQSTAFLTTV